MRLGQIVRVHLPGKSYDKGAFIIRLLFPSSNPVSNPDSVLAKLGDMMATDATSWRYLSPNRPPPPRTRREEKVKEVSGSLRSGDQS